MKNLTVLNLLAGLSLAVLLAGAVSCTKGESVAAQELVAFPGTLDGAVDSGSPATFPYSGDGGTYSVSLCDCGRYAALTDNPWYDSAVGEAASVAHYRYFFSAGDPDAVLFWFTNIDELE